jgi:phosphoserine phosphatase
LASSAAVAVIPIDRLAPGSWKGSVKLALERFAADLGRDSERYDPEQPPVAVLAWDDAAVAGDLGELVFQRLVRKVEFKFDDDWWSLVPLAYGRQRIRAAHEQFYGLPQAAWPSQPTYQQFQKFMLESYRDSCRKVSRKDCRMYLARLLKGFAREEIAEYARSVIEEEAQRAFEPERVGQSPEDQDPVTVRRGLREIPEMKDLCRLLLAAGFDVWVVDAEPSVLLSTSAPAYGVAASRVLGIKQTLFRGALTGKIEEPVPFGSGKVDALLGAVGRPPALVVASSYDDRELLRYGSGLRLILDRGDPLLREEARKRGWLVQPPFP